MVVPLEILFFYSLGTARCLQSQSAVYVCLARLLMRIFFLCYVFCLSCNIYRVFLLRVQGYFYLLVKFHCDIQRNIQRNIDPQENLQYNRRVRVKSNFKSCLWNRFLCSFYPMFSWPSLRNEYPCESHRNETKKTLLFFQLYGFWLVFNFDLRPGQNLSRPNLGYSLGGLTLFFKELGGGG